MFCLWESNSFQVLHYQSAHFCESLFHRFCMQKFEWQSHVYCDKEEKRFSQTCRTKRGLTKDFDFQQWHWNHQFAPPLHKWKKTIWANELNTYSEICSLLSYIWWNAIRIGNWHCLPIAWCLKYSRKLNFFANDAVTW